MDWLQHRQISHFTSLTSSDRRHGHSQCYLMAHSQTRGFLRKKVRLVTQQMRTEMSMSQQVISLSMIDWANKSTLLRFPSVQPAWYSAAKIARLFSWPHAVRFT